MVPISRRAASRALRPLSSYFPIASEAMERPWTPEDMDGNIVMVIAENRLLTSKFKAKWESQESTTLTSSYFYEDMRGTPRLRKALADFMSTHVTKTPVLPENLALGNGCGSVLDTLFHILCDDGEACLLPSPCYPTFINDIESRANVRVQMVRTTAEKGYFPSLRELNEGYKAAANAGAPPKVLLLTNPTNPLGTVFDSEGIRSAIKWAASRGLHVISDEIYANSVFGHSAKDFASAWDIDDSVHVVYGLSKDFGISGFRIGAVASRHADVIRTFDNLGYMMTIPGVIQEGIATILDDKEWVASFLCENRNLLRASFSELEGALRDQRIPFEGGEAAMFAWIDLSAWLPPNATFDDERRLFEKMHGSDPGRRGGGILLTPGHDCRAQRPGFFRMCWAASPPAAHKEAARRIRVAADDFARARG